MRRLSEVLERPPKANKHAGKIGPVITVTSRRSRPSVFLRISQLELAMLGAQRRGGGVL